MDKIEFINGQSSHLSYLIIGRKGPSYMGLRRLATGGEPIYRIHCYPNLAAFKLPQPTGDTPGFKYTAVRREHGYETVHMNGDEHTRNFLLPGLASRGVSSMEFDAAVKTLIEQKPQDNTLGHGGYQGEGISAVLGLDVDDEPTGLDNLGGAADGAQGDDKAPGGGDKPSSPSGAPSDL